MSQEAKDIYTGIKKMFAGRRSGSFSLGSGRTSSSTGSSITRLDGELSSAALAAAEQPEGKKKERRPSFSFSGWKEKHLTSSSAKKKKEAEAAAASVNLHLPYGATAATPKGFATPKGGPSGLRSTSSSFSSVDFYTASAVPELTHQPAKLGRSVSAVGERSNVHLYTKNSRTHFSTNSSSTNGSASSYVSLQQQQQPQSMDSLRQNRNSSHAHNNSSISSTNVHHTLLSGPAPTAIAASASSTHATPVAAKPASGFVSAAHYNSNKENLLNYGNSGIGTHRPSASSSSAILSPTQSTQKSMKATEKNEKEKKRKEEKEKEKLEKEREKKEKKEKKEREKREKRERSRTSSFSFTSSRKNHSLAAKTASTMIADDMSTIVKPHASTWDSDSDDDFEDTRRPTRGLDRRSASMDFMEQTTPSHLISKIWRKLPIQARLMGRGSIDLDLQKDRNSFSRSSSAKQLSKAAEAARASYCKPPSPPSDDNVFGDKHIRFDLQLLYYESEAGYIALENYDDVLVRVCNFAAHDQRRTTTKVQEFLERSMAFLHGTPTKHGNVVSISNEEIRMWRRLALHDWASEEITIAPTGVNGNKESRSSSAASTDDSDSDDQRRREHYMVQTKTHQRIEEDQDGDAAEGEEEEEEDLTLPDRLSLSGLLTVVNSCVNFGDCLFTSDEIDELVRLEFLVEEDGWI